MTNMMHSQPDLPAVVAGWFEERGWRIRQHQIEMIDAARAGAHALLVADTGSGKTLGGFLPVFCDLAENPAFEGLHTLYISPLKALAVDVQRNLLDPISAMGLPLRVETRTGDTPSDRKARQRVKPPHILLTTPESLSLLLSYPGAGRLLGTLRTVIVDEVHAFAASKRGDLLSLALARLETLVPGLRRVALSATVGAPDDYRRWLSPGGQAETVRLVRGEKGRPPEITILAPEGRVPWAGHSGRYAVEQVYQHVKAHRQTLIFCNTRGLAELIFQDLWALNEDALPIGIHHGSLSVEARRKVEGAMASGRLRGLVATASLDLGVDWGDIDLVIQMGAPKGASRLLQRIGRANHRLDEASQALIVPGNRFEYLEAQAALDALKEGALDREIFRPGGLDVLAQHLMGCGCAEPFDADQLYAEIRSATPYQDLTRERFDQLLSFVENGGYALRAYDRYRRLTQNDDGRWRVSHPSLALSHRLNAGVIVEAPMIEVCFRNGRKIGQLEDHFASTLSPGDTFVFSGLNLEVEGFRDAGLIVRASRKAGRIPAYTGARLALTTHLADRVRHYLYKPEEWNRFPDDVRLWLDMQLKRSYLPAPDEMLAETFPHDGRHYLVAYPFEGWNAHQALGLLITRRMEDRGLMPLGFQASDYAFAIWSARPVDDIQPLFSGDILEDEFIEWVQGSLLLKRAFREVAVIGGLIERQFPGKRKTGRQITFSSDLIYDVLRRYEPEHLLLQAAWQDARTRLTDVDRLARILERSNGALVHQKLSRVSPLAVPVLVQIGREMVGGRETEDLLLTELEESLIARAMA